MKNLTRPAVEAVAIGEQKSERLLEHLRHALLVVGFTCGASLAGAATITVNTLADELNADGDCSLREAVESANFNAAVDACTAGTAGADLILLPAGTIPVAATILVNESVTIRGTGRASTTINRGGGANAFNAPGMGVNTAVEDLALAGGLSATPGALAATRVDFLAPGGGISTANGPITLTDVTLGSGNYASIGTVGAMVVADSTISGGAYLANGSGPITLTGSALNGGYISTSSGAISVVNSTVGASAYLSSSSGAITVTDSGLSGADYISNGSGSVTLTRTTIAGALSTAISTSTSTVTLIDSSVTGSANAGIASSNGAVSLTRSLVSGSGQNGIDVGGGTVTAVNSTISGNQRRGINAFSGTAVTLNAVTITGNTLGGLSSGAAAGTTAVHTIFGPNGGANCGAAVAASSYSIDTSTTCALVGTGDLSITNPNLGALANNGGPTLTHLPQPGSAAIDRGSNGACQAVDQRGFARPVDGDGNGTATCDIGAVEVVAAFAPGVAAAIPTLSKWGLMLLALLLGLVCAWRIRSKVFR